MSEEKVIKVKKRRVSKFLTLNPYGDNLRSPQTSFWFICVGIVIFLMAFSEGFVWGNLFNFYLSEALDPIIRIPLCLGIGFFVFSIIWLIDSTFILLDRSEQPLLEQPIGRSGKIKAFVKQYILNKNVGKFWLGFVTRIFVVGLSLYITIPAITNLSISPDINKSIQDENNRIRAEFVEKFKPSNIDKIVKLDSIIPIERKNLELEVAGKGKSGRYGDDVVAKTIRENLVKYEEELKVEKDKAKEEKDFVDTASNEILSEKYGVEFKKRTAGVVNEVAKELSENENYKQVEKIARTYVLLLFIALVLFKIFAPRSVKIYLNEELQDLYKAFKNNQINSVYFANFRDEFDNTKEITPYRFYEFWKNFYFKTRFNDMANLIDDGELKKLDLKIGKFNQQKSDIEKELKPNQDEFLQETDKLLSLEDEKNKLTLQTDTNTGKIAEINTKINTIKSSKSEIEAEYLIELSRQQNSLIKEKEELTMSLKKVENEIFIKTKRIEFVKNKITTINKELNALQNNLDKVIELKECLRNQYLESLR